MHETVSNCTGFLNIKQLKKVVICYPDKNARVCEREYLKYQTQQVDKLYNPPTHGLLHSQEYTQHIFLANKILKNLPIIFEYWNHPISEETIHSSPSPSGPATWGCEGMFLLGASKGGGYLLRRFGPGVPPPAPPPPRRPERSEPNRGASSQPAPRPRRV